MKEQTTYQRMLETQIAELMEDIQIEFGSEKTYDEPEYEIEDEINEVVVAVEATVNLIDDELDELERAIMRPIEPMVERKWLVNVENEEHCGLGRVNDKPRDPVLEVDHALLDYEEMEIEAIIVNEPDHHLDEIDVGVIEEEEGMMEESSMPPPEVKFSVKTLPPSPICAYIEETGPKSVVITLTFSLDMGDPTKGMSPPTHKYYTIFEDGIATSFGLLDIFHPNFWDVNQKKIQEALVFKEGISTIKGEEKGLCYELIEGRFDPRPPD